MLRLEAPVVWRPKHGREAMGRMGLSWDQNEYLRPIFHFNGLGFSLQSHGELLKASEHDMIHLCCFFTTVLS